MRALLQSEDGPIAIPDNTLDSGQREELTELVDSGKVRHRSVSEDAVVYWLPATIASPSQPVDAGKRGTSLSLRRGSRKKMKGGLEARLEDLKRMQVQVRDHFNNAKEVEDLKLETLEWQAAAQQVLEVMAALPMARDAALTQRKICIQMQIDPVTLDLDEDDEDMD